MNSESTIMPRIAVPLKLLLGIGTCLAIACALGQTVSNTELRERYVRIIRTSTLEWNEKQPFFLKLEFQLFSLDGKPAEKGTAQESWGEGSGYLTDFHSPSLDSEEFKRDPLKSHNRESFLVKQVLAAVVRPISRMATINAFAMDEIRRTIDGTDEACFLVSSTGVSESTAFCPDQDGRITALTSDIFIVRRKNFRKFLDHEVPLDIEVSYQGRIAMTAHLTELESLPAVASETPGKAATEVATRIPSSVMAGKIINKKTPEYPKKAKKKKIEGAVLLTAIISKQGTIEGLDVVASPDPLLSQSALEAVQGWTYQPYLLKGNPTAVDTTITVTYNLNRN